jgi:hypothetical protein
MATVNFTNAANYYQIIAGHFLAPGQSVDIEESLITQADLDAALAGDFTTTPALDAGFSTAAESSIEGDAVIQKIIAQFNSGNKAFQLPDDDATPGIITTAGATEQNQYVCVVDGDGVVNAFDQTSQVTVEIITDATGGATIEGGSGSGASSSPGSLDGAIRLVDMIDGKFLFKVLKGGGTGIVTVGLVDTEATGYDASSTIEIDFVALP